jgi:hypothetical protein
MAGGKPDGVGLFVPTKQSHFDDVELFDDDWLTTSTLIRRPMPSRASRAASNERRLDRLPIIL